jgi:hypothetical protein
MGENDMDWKNNKLVCVVVVVFVLNLLFFISYQSIVNRVTNAVINKIQKEYSPSPYGPGLDPDKLTPSSKTLYEELQQRQGNKKVYQEEVQSDMPHPEMVLSQDFSKNKWRSEWEKERGAGE